MYVVYHAYIIAVIFHKKMEDIYTDVSSILFMVISGVCLSIPHYHRRNSCDLNQPLLVVDGCLETGRHFTILRDQVIMNNNTARDAECMYVRVYV